VSLLRLDSVSLSFGGVRAVRELSFVVEPGEVFAIIGPNGAGKTSVFNIITRVFEPTAGRVLFDGRDITGVRRHEVATLGIARTFQNIELFEQATVLDNLMLGRHRFPHGGFLAQMLRLPLVQRQEDHSRAKVEAIIDLLDLSAYRDLPVSGLPYGIRKIVELARALATEPRLLLLDEPASGLNPEETQDLAFWIEDIQKDLGVTIVMVEHDMSLVSAAADRVLCMNMGQVLALGSPVEVQSNPDVVQAYLGH
jgi:branched-chain amino acid transport system ATP-binding protein